jgi:hypothetical protein
MDERKGSIFRAGDASVEDGKVTSFPNQADRMAEVIKLCAIDTSGELDQAGEIAVYVPGPKPRERAVFVVGLRGPSLTFVRWEHWNEPEEVNARDQAWSGRKIFGQSAPSKEMKLQAKELFQKLLAMEGADLLAFAVRVARTEADLATAWAESRIRAIAARPREETNRRSSSLTSAIYGVEQHESALRDAWYRLKAFQRATHALGLTPRPAEEE